MPLYRYEIVSKGGKTLSGAMDASSENEVYQNLTAKGFLVNFIMASQVPNTQAGQSAVRQTAAPMPVGQVSGLSAPMGELAIFFRQIQSLLHSGMNAYQALIDITKQTRNRSLRMIIDRMASRIQAGDKLSQAMSEFPSAFPPHVLGIVAAGELGGFLPIVLGDIALDYELKQRASSRVMKFIAWMLWINAFGCLFLVPFVPSLLTPGVESLSDAFHRYLQITIPYILIPMVIAVGVYHIAAAILRRRQMRNVAHKLLLWVPSAGRASKERSVAVFSQILWRLMAAGVLPVTAWEAASQAAENVIVSQKLAGQAGAMRSGVKISDAIALTGLFSDGDKRVLSIAEASGQTVDSLHRIASYYEDAARTSAGRFKSFGLRISIWATVLATAAVLGSIAMYYNMVFPWVDKFMGVD